MVISLWPHFFVPRCRPASAAQSTTVGLHDGLLHPHLRSKVRWVFVGLRQVRELCLVGSGLIRVRVGPVGLWHLLSCAYHH